MPFKLLIFERHRVKHEKRRIVAAAMIIIIHRNVELVAEHCAFVHLPLSRFFAYISFFLHHLFKRAQVFGFCQPVSQCPVIIEINAVILADALSLAGRKALAEVDAGKV